MINLLYCGNAKVFDGLFISLLSIARHTNDKLNVFCLTMDLREQGENNVPISKEQIEFIQGVLRKYNSETIIHLIDVKDKYLNIIGNGKNAKTRFTPYSMLRLLADEIEEIPDKIIYLDTDTVANDDLHKLWDIDINEYELGTVDDLFNWMVPSRWFIRHYFNSGVLLINVEMIKKTKLFEKTRKYMETHKLLFPDQDALNRCVTKKLVLPVIFNSKDKYYKEIVVHHFCNVRKKGNYAFRVKPWMVDLVKELMSAYDDLLDEYLMYKAEFENKIKAKS